MPSARPLPSVSTQVPVTGRLAVMTRRVLRIRGRRRHVRQQQPVNRGPEIRSGVCLDVVADLVENVASRAHGSTKPQVMDNPTGIDRIVQEHACIDLPLAWVFTI
jgi:hypothetical protein